MDERNPERSRLPWKAAAPFRTEIKGGTFIRFASVLGLLLSGAKQWDGKPQHLVGRTKKKKEKKIVIIK